MGMIWGTTYENDLPAREHLAIGSLLREGFPTMAPILRDGRSWVGSRPEQRLMCRDESTGRYLAHVGFHRKILRVGSEEVLVAEPGLLCVTTGLRGTGLGAELVRRMNEQIVALNVDFGFFNCRELLVPYYTAKGWSEVAEDVRTRMQSYVAPLSPEYVHYRAVILPARRDASQWPAADRIDKPWLEL